MKNIIKITLAVSTVAAMLLSNNIEIDGEEYYDYAYQVDMYDEAHHHIVVNATINETQFEEIEGSTLVDSCSFSELTYIVGNNAIIYNEDGDEIGIIKGAIPVNSYEIWLVDSQEVRIAFGEGYYFYF